MEASSSFELVPNPVSELTGLFGQGRSHELKAGQGPMDKSAHHDAE